MIRLRPMTSTEFAIWRSQTIPAYAADTVRMGLWSEAESLAEAEKIFNHLLPQGLETAGQHIFTIETESETSVGSLWIGRAERPAGPIGFIYDLFISPEHRRNGYATQAMHAIEREAQRLGLKGLALHVFGHNHLARDFDVKLGYATTTLDMFKHLAPKSDNSSLYQS